MRVFCALSKAVYTTPASHRKTNNRLETPIIARLAGRAHRTPPREQTRNTPACLLLRGASRQVRPCGNKLEACDLALRFFGNDRIRSRSHRASVPQTHPRFASELPTHACRAFHGPRAARWSDHHSLLGMGGRVFRWRLWRRELARRLIAGCPHWAGPLCTEERTPFLSLVTGVHCARMRAPSGISLGL